VSREDPHDVGETLRVPSRIPSRSIIGLNTVDVRVWNGCVA
jgi:hypothetical protein